MRAFNLKPGTVTNKTKSKNARRAQKLKLSTSLIEYGDPDSKVAVRLLPPTLDKNGFLEQAKESSPILRAGCKSFTYIKGRRTEQAFEEPNLSLALIKFSSSEAAERFKEEISQLSFTEKETGDNIKCHTMKPIIGDISTAMSPTVDVNSIKNDVFKAFFELREKNEGHVDIMEAITTAKALSKQKKTKVKHQKKKSGKEKTSCAKILPHDPLQGEADSGLKNATKPTPEGKIHDPKNQRNSNVGESRKDIKPKKKNNRKPKKVTQPEFNTQGPTQQGPTQQAVAVMPKPSKKPPKKKKKKNKSETEAVYANTVK